MSVEKLESITNSINQPESLTKLNQPVSLTKPAY